LARTIFFLHHYMDSSGIMIKLKGKFIKKTFADDIVLKETIEKNKMFEVAL